jgi:hypothetical protein
LISSSTWPTLDRSIEGRAHRLDARHDHAAGAVRQPESRGRFVVDFPHRHAQQRPALARRHGLLIVLATTIPLRALGELDRDVHRAAVPQHLQRAVVPGCRPAIRLDERVVAHDRLAVHRRR